MAVSKKQQASVNKYIKGNYDRVNLVLTKGKKESIQTHAADHGESLNAFINRAIDETVERDIENDEAGWAEIEAFHREYDKKKGEKIHASS